MGWCTFWLRVLLVWGFSGVLVGFAGIGRPGLPQLPMVEGPYKHFTDSILSAWRDSNSADLCRRKGFRGGLLLDFRRSMQLLDSSHVRDRDKALLRAILSGGVWRGENVPCRFCGVRMEMVTCFGSVLTPLVAMTLSIWMRPGLPLLSNLAGPVQHFKAALLYKVAADLCGRAGFRGGPLLDVHGSLQLLISSHVRERDKALLRSVLVGGVWNGFLLGRVRSQLVPCRFCGAPDGDAHLVLGVYLSSSC